MNLFAICLVFIDFHNFYLICLWQISIVVTCYINILLEVVLNLHHPLRQVRRMATSKICITNHR